ncbi:RNA polymerase [Western grey kangaroopox virus]|uniref:DNA-directed RNA polymerase 35 kDa subunit n=1 Tax=Western grey kangaroopox virus TaxID=1566307 RepID=A0A2C9DST5_9POXV|nr:RNA polymerase [Western grey kangaroopox virus]ATI21068.1 RNA polymerase [Western grey kangaroopox virus]
MYRSETRLHVRLPESVATFIKHGCQRYVRFPLLSKGVVMVNTTTSINEEWLTSVEAMPTRKVFHRYAREILERRVDFCVYLRKTQGEDDTYVSMYDFEYYIIRDGHILEKLPPIEQLKETLVHSFLDYRPKNIKTIEMIAFSSGTEINDDLVRELSSFLDVEVFNREHMNIKTVYSKDYESDMPFRVIAPRGELRFFVEKYPWVDFAEYLGSVLGYLRERLLADIEEHRVKSDITAADSGASAYDVAAKVIAVNDLLTMSIVNFFGGNAQIGTYHPFDLSAVNLKSFVTAVDEAFTRLLENIA